MSDNSRTSIHYEIIREGHYDQIQTTFQKAEDAKEFWLTHQKMCPDCRHTKVHIDEVLIKRTTIGALDD